MLATQPYQSVPPSVNRLAEPTPQQLNPPDSTPALTGEELGKMRLNELCALWMEGRL
jgi:hypothetical protein